MSHYRIRKYDNILIIDNIINHDMKRLFLEIEKQEECLVQRVDNELARDPKLTNCRSNANVKQQRFSTSSYVIEQLHMGKTTTDNFSPISLKRFTKLNC
jgi:hypothetical protein